MYSCSGNHNSAPSARPRVAFACAVAKNYYRFFLLFHYLQYSLKVVKFGQIWNISYTGGRMSKPSPNELLQLLHGYEKMFKKFNILAKRKTELSKVEEMRSGETVGIKAEFENMHAILPELIASVRRNKDLDKAA